MTETQRRVIAISRAIGAGGEEIVASSAIKAQLDPAHVEFGSVHRVPLKGFSGTHEVWPVVISGKPEEGGST